jgi:hypothetical protein
VSYPPSAAAWVIFPASDAVAPPGITVTEPSGEATPLDFDLAAIDGSDPHVGRLANAAWVLREHGWAVRGPWRYLAGRWAIAVEPCEIP